MNLAEYAIKRKTVTLAITLSLFIWGAISYTQLSRLEDPEFTIKDALVITQYPGADPGEVEEQITDIIEIELLRMPQVKQVKSISIAGQSIITVSMLDQYGKSALPDIWSLLRAKIDDITSELPPGASQPRVLDDYGDVYGFVYALLGDGYSQKNLVDYAEKLREELLLLDGIAKVDIWGEPQDVIYVDISRAKLTASNRNLTDIQRLFQGQNTIELAGAMKVGPDYVRFQSLAAFDAVDDIKNLLITSSSGSENERLLYLRDVADISREYKAPASRSMLYNGTPSVGLAISNEPGANIVELGGKIQTLIDELHADIPIGLEARPVILQSEAVDKAIGNFINSLIQAVSIVVVVLLIFMGLRSGLIIGCVLLVTVVVTFAALNVSGVALERISLGALIISLGMLVDNAIVICEGMLVRIKQGKDRLEAAKEVVAQNKWPLFGATGIAILAFSSIGLSQDATGEFCRSLFIVILCSLLISWVVALTLTPLLCYWFLPGPNERVDESSEPTDPYDTKLYRWYKSVLIAAVTHRYKVILASVATLVIALYSFGFVAQSFFPKSSMPYFMVHYWLPEGTDIRTTEDDIEQISDFLTAQPEITSATGFIGEGAPRFILVYGPELTNSSYGMMLVHVNDYRDIDKLMPRVETYLADNFPNAEPKLQRFSVGPSPQSSVEVRISGRDPKELRRLSQAVQGIIREHGGQATRDNWRQRIKTIEPQFSERQASFAGITRSDVNQALALNSTGSNVGLYREGNDLIPIYARLANAEEDNIADLVNIQVWSSLAQTYVPILQVVDSFKPTWSDSRVQRRDRKPTITVGAEPKDGVLAGELIARIKSPIEALELPNGYELEWGGELESSSDAQGSLVNGIIISLCVMVIISILLFNSLRQPFIIWVVVPFAIIGVSAGLLITGLPFGFMSLLGFLSLMGMLVKNVIVLLEQAVIDEREGMAKYDAIIHAAVSRARPVIMAAGTTVLGMIPLLSDAFFSSMAVTIMAGLAIASMATLVLVPALFAAVYNVKSTA